MLVDVHCMEVKKGRENFDTTSVNPTTTRVLQRTRRQGSYALRDVQGSLRRRLNSSRNIFAIDAFRFALLNISSFGCRLILVMIENWSSDRLRVFTDLMISIVTSAIVVVGGIWREVVKFEVSIFLF